MKHSIKEKFILIIPIILLCIITAVCSVNTNRRLNEMQKASAVVIHDVPVTNEEEKKQMIVYITPSGEKYHLGGCEYISDKAIKTTLEQAIRSGYESCTYCQP